MSPWPRLALPVALGLLAVADRVYRLDARSLWLDEILTAQTASLGGPADVVAWCQAAINQMPLFYFLTWLAGRWGDSGVLLRLPAMLAGILAVAAVYLLGRRLLGFRAGLVAGLLMTVMPFAVWYSQEARAYSLLMALTAFQVLFAYEAVVRGRPADWLGLSVFTTLALYTHYLALVTTLAVAVYVGGYLLARILARSSHGPRLTAAAILVVLCAAAALLPIRALLRAGYLHLAAAPGRPLRTAALAIAVVLVEGVLGALAVLLWRRSEELRPAVEPKALRMLAGAIGAGALVALLYAPWLPSLRIFLSRPDQSILRFDTSQSATLTGAIDVLSRLGLSGLLLVVFLAGLGVLVAWLLGGDRPAAALLLTWVLVPVLVTWLSVHGAIVAIDLRYFAPVFPAATLVIAAAVEAASRRFASRSSANLNRVLSRLRLGAASAMSIAVVALLMAQGVPALVASYGLNKDDYRATARHIAAASPAGSVVISLGSYSDWTVICLGYYFHELHAPITVVEASQLDGDVARTLASGSGSVWGVVIFPSAQQLSALSAAAAPVADFTDVTGNLRTIRSRSQGLPPLEQAQDLLRWEEPLDPRLGAPDRLLDLAAGRARLGANLVAAPGDGAWSLPKGTGTGAGLLLMNPTASTPEVTAGFSASLPAPGDYAVAFDCDVGSLNGAQRVFAIVEDAAGKAIATWPGGYGFQCPASGGWHPASFAFEAPAGAASFTLLLRAGGRGMARFRDLVVAPMEAAA